MDIGMLWFDNDKGADFAVKVKRAVDYYKKKYGQIPNLCFVHPCMIPVNGNGNQPRKRKPKGNGSNLKNSGVEIRETQSMLPNHFWIGIRRRKSVERQALRGG